MTSAATADKLAQVVARLQQQGLGSLVGLRGAGSLELNAMP
jgi:hypothetical protein